MVSGSSCTPKHSLRVTVMVSESNGYGEVTLTVSESNGNGVRG
jgi:hypothetical protein